MDGWLLLILGLGAFAAAALAIIEYRQRRIRAATWQTLRLRFGRDLDDETAVGLLTSLAGVGPGRSVALEARASGAGIAHYLSGDRATLDNLRASFRALLPNARLEAVTSQVESSCTHGLSIRLRGRLRTLRQDDLAATNASLLAALQPLGKEERLVMRWLISPSAPQAVPSESGGRPVPAEHQRLLRAKNDGVMLRAAGTMAVRSGHQARAAQLLGRLRAPLRSRSTAYGYLKTTPLHGRLIRRVLERRHLWRGDRYGANELGALLAWPLAAPSLPGLSLGTSPQLIPSQRLPEAGRVIGEATWPGAQRPVAQPLLGAMSHTLIAGPTGVGKSTLLTNLITADMAAGRGTLLLDGKGDTAAAVLARVPQSRLGDVIVLDCARSGPQPGLQLFGSADAELAADVVLGVLSDLFRDSWGPLSERYLRAGLLAVSHDPDGTLADVPYVFSDATYRRRLVGRLGDPLTKATFAAFEQMSAAARQHQLAAPLGKLGTLLGRPIVRTVLGQPTPSLDFNDVLCSGKLVVVSLAPGRVGAPAARLIGALTVFGLFGAIQSRASLPESQRHPFLVYIDEPRALGDLPMPLDALLEQARGLRVGVTLAPQSMAQLPRSVREAALTNIASRVVFRQHADDARLLARDLGVDPEQLGDLAAFEAVARIGLGPGDVAPAVSLRTLAIAKATGDGDKLAAHSTERWGSSLGQVDGALGRRHRQPQASAPLGRRRRAP